MAEIAILVAVIALLIVCNGVFVAAEFAIAGVPRASIERRAAAGHRAARVVQRVLANPRSQDQYIATAQIGITAATLGLGMYGEHALASLIYDGLHRDGVAAWLASHAVASILAVAVITYFHIVIGEMVPKALALQRAEQTALWITPPMLWIRRAAYPLVWGLNSLGIWLLGLFGVRREIGSEQFYSSEELELIVRESTAGGLLRSEASAVLTELFDFGELTAGDLMTPRVNVHGIPIGATAEEVGAIVRASRHSRYPVFERDLDHIIGYLHIKDVFRRLPSPEPISETHVRNVPFLPETSMVDSIMEVMRRERAQIAVVLDEHGGTAGIVTIEDMFEEVTGRIPEAPGELPELEPGPAGELHCAGTVRLEEVGEFFERELEHDEVETVSGLILALLDRPPAVGDTVTYERFAFTVEETAGHGVARATITYLADPSEEDETGD